MGFQFAVSKTPNAPLVNGRGYSLQSISFEIDGIQYKFGLVSVNYKSSLESKPLESAAARPVAQTLGKVTETFDFELYSQWGKALLSQMGAGYGVKYRTFIVQKNERDDLGQDDPQTDTIVARIKAVDQSSSDALTMKFEGTVARMEINGVDILPKGR